MPEQNYDERWALVSFPLPSLISTQHTDPAHYSRETCIKQKMACRRAPPPRPPSARAAECLCTIDSNWRAPISVHHHVTKHLAVGRLSDISGHSDTTGPRNTTAIYFDTLMDRPAAIRCVKRVLNITAHRVTMRAFRQHCGNLWSSQCANTAFQISQLVVTSQT